MFDTTQDDLNNLLMILKLAKSRWECFCDSRLQQVKLLNSWQWNAFLQEVKGDGEARLVNIDGYSRAGQWAYGTVWVTAVNVITIYNILNTPYAGIDANITEKLNFSGSLDMIINVDGTIADGNTQGQLMWTEMVQ
jgi:hypothetical protein